VGSATDPTAPAVVPEALFTRLPDDEPARPTVTSIVPAPVPAAHPVRIVPEQLTAEQVDQLRAENAALRAELDRVRSR